MSGDYRMTDGRDGNWFVCGRLERAWFKYVLRSRLIKVWQSDSDHRGNHCQPPSDDVLFTSELRHDFRLNLLDEDRGCGYVNRSTDICERFSHYSPSEKSDYTCRAWQKIGSFARASVGFSVGSLGRSRF
jgi:hypothetical protein